MCSVCGKRAEGLGTYPTQFKDIYMCTDCYESLKAFKNGRGAKTSEILKEKYRLAMQEMRERNYPQNVIDNVEAWFKEGIQEKEAKENAKKDDGFMMTTCPTFEGYRILSYHGIISGESVLGTGFISSWEASVADMTGTESEAFIAKLQDAKVAAKKRIIERCLFNGGNAIVGVDIEYTMFNSNMIGVILTGTAVKIEKIEEIFQGKDDFSNIRNEKMGLFHSHIDGNSSKRLFAEMNNLLENNIKDSGKEVGKYFFPNVSPLYQYTLNATAEFYFDFGDGFTEQAKVTKDYEVTNEIISFEIDIPKGAKNIRFDPDEIGKWILKDFKVQLDHETVPYTVIVGREVDDAIYLTQYDPQILINLNDKYYQTIKISFYCLDMYANISIVMDEVNKLDKQLNDTKNTLIEAKNRISFMENSRSWKITKPLRDASEIVKRIKNHKK